MARQELMLSAHQIGSLPQCFFCNTILANYGNPRAVVIADKRDQLREPHGWFKGLKPHVQTMGDGKIHLFKGGKLFHMTGSKERK